MLGYTRVDDLGHYLAVPILHEEPSVAVRALWKVIWAWLGPPRIRTFLWLLTRNRFLTNSERCRRHLSSSNGCVWCGLEEETYLHVLRDCPLAKNIWNRLLPAAVSSQFFDLPLDHWLELNLLHGADIGHMWDRTFGVVVWKIWKWRNEFIFQARSDSVGRGDFVFLDGSGSAGGLLWDENGNWLGGFTVNIDYCSSMAAKLWGLFRGLSLAWDLGYRQVEAEVDNASVMSFAESLGDVSGVHSGLMRRIKDLMCRSWQVKVKHVYREANFPADFMASFTAEGPMGYHSFSVPPSGEELARPIHVRKEITGKKVSRPRTAITRIPMASPPEVKKTMTGQIPSRNCSSVTVVGGSSFGHLHRPGAGSHRFGVRFRGKSRACNDGDYYDPFYGFNDNYRAGDNERDDSEWE
ncbi:Polynucleotidyl transferase- ribonuclease H-like superfamily protein [Striga hermonthica]|uniref:Polynucleotidyl transferase- ribonuclease H-like superfamily protein n=1 Tax=Striga hermonthica TaxID=68872 RepID=A0A9N7RHC3_STRHE|nr:Polynucleotidyl transferase- ribonuclease H-like superfamily protein [Striga hermonthica]